MLWYRYSAANVATVTAAEEPNPEPIGISIDNVISIGLWLWAICKASKIYLIIPGLPFFKIYFLFFVSNSASKPKSSDFNIVLFDWVSLIWTIALLLTAAAIAGWLYTTACSPNKIVYPGADAITSIFTLP